MGLPGDHGGHLIAAQLGGYGGRANLAPQNNKLNGGPWVQIENQVGRCARASEMVAYRVDLHYPDDLDVRPAEWQAQIDLYEPFIFGIRKTADFGHRINNVTPTEDDRYGVATVLAALRAGGHCS